MLKLTTESFFTGSKATSLLYPLEGDDLKRYVESVDETYADFTNRVCEGRSISPEIVDHIAGGRVFTGWRAYGLTAPKELLPILYKRYIEKPPSLIEEPAVLNEEVEARPFEEKIDIEVESIPEIEGPVHPKEEAVAPVVSVNEDESDDSKPVAVGGAVGALAFLNAVQSAVGSSLNADEAGTKEPQLGPLGRGIIDGLGGLYDAAVLAATMSIAHGLEHAREEAPDRPAEEIVAGVLDSYDYSIDESGKVDIQMLIRLKIFPVRRGFLQQLLEASMQGDALHPVESAKAALGSYFARWAIKSLVNELGDLGLNDVRRHLGLGSSTRQRWLRAEVPVDRFRLQ